MFTGLFFGHINPHIVGIVMKEAVRRAIMAIRSERFVFEAKAKTGYSGQLDDIVTTADNKAQAIYIRMISECFPLCGIVAEEEGLRVECTLPGGVSMFFTVDALDGTKAFARKQSHGIGTMISLVYQGRVIAAYVGDVMSQEIYGFRPESQKVHRISEYDHHEILAIRPNFKLSEQYVLLRADPHKRGSVIQTLIAPKENGGIFRGIEVTSGSIGMSMARLWKGEVGGAVLNPGHSTPWDFCPVIGISTQLGFVFLKDEGGKLFQFKPEAYAEIRKIEHDVLIIHESRLAEVQFLAG